MPLSSARGELKCCCAPFLPHNVEVCRPLSILHRIGRPTTSPQPKPKGVRETQLPSLLLHSHAHPANVPSFHLHDDPTRFGAFSEAWQSPSHSPSPRNHHVIHHRRHPSHPLVTRNDLRNHPWLVHPCPTRRCSRRRALAPDQRSQKISVNPQEHTRTCIRGNGFTLVGPFLYTLATQPYPRISA